MAWLWVFLVTRTIVVDHFHGFAEGLLMGAALPLTLMVAGGLEAGGRANYRKGKRLRGTIEIMVGVPLGMVSGFIICVSLAAPLIFVSEVRPTWVVGMAFGYLGWILAIDHRGRPKPKPHRSDGTLPSRTSSTSQTVKLV